MMMKTCGSDILNDRFLNKTTILHAFLFEMYEVYLTHLPGDYVLNYSGAKQIYDRWPV
jgi:hypothetical protein